MSDWTLQLVSAQVSQFYVVCDYIHFTNSCLTSYKDASKTYEKFHPSLCPVVDLLVVFDQAVPSKNPSSAVASCNFLFD